MSFMPRRSIKSWRTSLAGVASSFCFIAICTQPAVALEPERLASFWQSYLDTCGPALLDPNGFHDNPVERFATDPDAVELWRSTQDGHVTDFSAEMENESLGYGFQLGLVSNRTQSLIEQSCDVAFEAGLGTTAATSAALVNGFAGSAMTLRGGDFIDRKTGRPNTSAGEGDSEFVLQGAFPGRDVITVISVYPGAMVIEHLIYLPH